jgi:ACS family D-galactonate transporter-like MFS transporter
MPRFRFVVMGALWLTAFFLFLDRVNMSLAAPALMDELGLTGVQTGFILSVYYWGYITGQLGGGIASDKFTIRSWATVMFLAWCVLTALTGACHTVTQFAVVRGLFGVAEGAVANPLNKLENQWVLPHERGWAYGMLLACGYLGIITGMLLVGWLISLWGWRAMFYGTGALTLLGVGVFWLLVYDHPRDHPWVTSEERTLIEDAITKDRVTFDPHRGTTRPLSFGEGLRLLGGHWSFWCVCFCMFFILGVFFTNLSWLPGYLVKERGYTVIKSGLYLTLPYVAALCGAVGGGCVGDRTGYRSAVGFATSFLIGPAMIGVMLSQDMHLTLVLVGIALFACAAAFNALIVMIFDLFPAEVVGVAAGVSIGLFGGLGGVTGPLVLGYSYDHTQSFFWGFCSLSIGAVLGSLALIPVMFHERRVKREKIARIASPPVLNREESVEPA